MSWWSAAGTLFSRRRSWSRERLLAYQSKQLEKLLAWSTARVRLYRGLYGTTAPSASCLGSLPILRKSVLQSAPLTERLAHTQPISRLISHRSSGCTGEPLTAMRTVQEDRLLSAFRLRAYFADWGARLTDRRVGVVFCAEVDGWTGGPRPSTPYMRVGIFPQTGIHCLLSPDRILRELRQARPGIVIGYPSTLAEVAALALERGDKSVRPRFVQSGGEPLQGGARRTIAAAFDAPVYDAYSSTECNLIGWECPETGLLHLSEDSIVVEVVDAEGAPAEEGEVVVTVLHSFEMPFIRFAIGDWAVRGPSPCPCGAPFATLRSVTGRSMEFFKLSDGRRIHPYAALEPMVAGIDWMRRFRLTQPTSERLRIEIIANREITADQVDELSRRATEKLGFTVDADLVTEIAPEKNGKLGPFVPHRRKEPVR